jgi:hypothetical protein
MNETERLLSLCIDLCLDMLDRRFLSDEDRAWCRNELRVLEAMIDDVSGSHGCGAGEAPSSHERLHGRLSALAGRQAESTSDTEGLS